MMACGSEGHDQRCGGFMTENICSFSSALAIFVLTRPADSDADWQEFDRGPGYFAIPADQEVRVRAKSINDEELYELVQELQDVETLRFLDLSENRNVTNIGLARLKALPQLTGLNLSSCSITDSGMENLRALTNLKHLNISYCNRLTDLALKSIEAIRSLSYVDIQGCTNITKGGISRIRHRNLTVHRK
jgi:hypothetical protein